MLTSHWDVCSSEVVPANTAYSYQRCANERVVARYCYLAGVGVRWRWYQRAEPALIEGVPARQHLFGIGLSPEWCVV
jgi:hypothetical protein